MVRRENDPREHARLLVAGLAFILVSALLIGLSIAIYNKAFHDYTTVTLEADRAGLQLEKYGDVRYNGVLVGQVRKVEQHGDEAVIELGIEPASAQGIPKAVGADIMPTTLFGQKYVALTRPQSNARGGDDAELGLADGTVIPPDKVHTSVELGQVLSRLFPLLRAVKPGDLSATLSALATALNGRGEQIGETLDKLEPYLGTINANLPTLQEDLRLLASVADTYDIAAPDLVATLGNLTVTSRTITSKKDEVARLLSGVTSLADVGTRVLRTNEVDAIRATALSVPIVRLLGRYAPEYNCLLRGAAKYKPLLLKTFAGGFVKQYIEFPATQVRGYDKRDIPRYDDHRGPVCYGLPNNVPEPWPGKDYRNGTDLDSTQGRGNSYFPAGAEPGPTFLQDLAQALTGQRTAYGVDPSDTPEGRRSTAAVLSSRTGRPAAGISTLSTLLYAPMVRQGVPAGGRA
jgi:phospholipid/cholesterol/gamma-HCH transport system substrate-binding protein